MTRKGIELLLKSSWTKTEIIEATNGNEAISQYIFSKPAVILIDYNMPEMNGFDASRILLKAHKNIRIILLSMFDTKPVVFNFLKIGGKGFVSKGSPPQDIGDAVRVVANGDYYYSSVYENEIIAWMANGTAQKAPMIQFSPLELEIVVKISKGKTSKEIGEELNLSPRTVETYRYDLLRKANAKNSYELIDYAYRNGIMM